MSCGREKFAPLSLREVWSDSSAKRRVGGTAAALAKKLWGCLREERTRSREPTANRAFRESSSDSSSSSSSSDESIGLMKESPDRGENIKAENSKAERTGCVPGETTSHTARAGTRLVAVKG